MKKNLVFSSVFLCTFLISNSCITNIFAMKRGPSDLPLELKFDTKGKKQKLLKPITSSIWNDIFQKKALSKKDKIDIFIDDCLKLKELNDGIPKHTKHSGTVRITTYNVHHWSNAYKRKNNFDNIMQTIKLINADILILQEVSWGKTIFNKHSKEELIKKFRGLGYEYLFFYPATQNLFGAPFGNAIFSKYSFKISPTGKIFNINEKLYKENRCYLHAIISLPNNHTLSVYGTHLDVFNSSGTVRSKQIEELIKIIREDDHYNILLAADFNEIRQQDYDPKIWDLIVKDNIKRKDKTPTNVGEHLIKNNFGDCFACTNTTMPQFSVWNGTVVDFIYLFNPENWQLPIAECYMFFDSASDHIPVIMDLMIYE